MVDTSAIVAILLDQPERDRLSQATLADEAAISAGNVIELMRVVMRRTRRLVPRIRPVPDTLRISIESVDEAQLDFAEEGQRRFGLGRREPPAVLDFGDRFAYALARRLGAPLLFMGDDLARTKLEPARW